MQPQPRAEEQVHQAEDNHSEYQDNGHGNPEPFRKSHAELMRRNGVGRGNHQRSHAADGGAVRHPQHGKGCRRLELFRRNAVQQADDQREHHGRRGRIGHPHGEERRSQENQDQGHPQASAGHPEDFSSQPGINFLFVESPGQRKAAEEQENGGIRKAGQCLRPRKNPHEHGEHRHQQGGHGHMQCFRQPQNADEGENGQPPGYIRLHGKPLEHGQEKKHVTRNDDVIAVSFGGVGGTVAHGWKNKMVLFPFVRLRGIESISFRKSPGEAPMPRKHGQERAMAHSEEIRRGAPGKIRPPTVPLYTRRPCHAKSRHAIARRLVKTV